MMKAVHTSLVNKPNKKALCIVVLLMSFALGVFHLTTAYAATTDSTEIPSSEEQELFAYVVNDADDATAQNADEMEYLLSENLLSENLLPEEPSLTEQAVRTKAPITVAIDPGHSANNPAEYGAVGYGGYARSEGVLNWKISNYLKEELECYEGVTVVFTKSSYEYVSLLARAQRASAAGADVLISIHNNAAPDDEAPGSRRGAAVYTPVRSAYNAQCYTVGSWYWSQNSTKTCCIWHCQRGSFPASPF